MTDAGDVVEATQGSRRDDRGGPAGAAPAHPERGRRRGARAVVLVVVVVAAVVATAIGAGRWLEGDPGPDVTVSADPAAAAPFDLADLRDPERRVTLAAFRGRPVVVNFFASTCVPCRKEMPDFQAVSDELGDRVAFVGIDHQDGRVGGLELVADTGVRYPTGYDPRGDVARDYGLIGLPTTVFISPDGKVLARRTGAMSRKELRRTIDRLFPAT